jgi:hypothetical protein
MIDTIMFLAERKEMFQMMMSNALEPRSGSVVIGNTPWLARMTDKARLEFDGTIAQFDLKYPCPMDQGLLDRLAMDAKTFQRIAVEFRDDEALFLNALKEAGALVQV